MRLDDHGSVRLMLCLVLGVLGFAPAARAGHAPAPQTAQTPQTPETAKPDLAAALAFPVSPASIALLVVHSNEPAAQARVREALVDPDPRVRAVAARVVIGAGLRLLIADVRVALKAEPNAYTGIQQIRALMTFQPDAIDDCVAAATRLGQPALDEAVRMFARVNSPALLAHLSTFEQAHAHQPVLVESLIALANADPTLRVRLLREFASDPAAVDAGLTTLRRSGDRSHDDLLLPLLKSDSDEVRTLAIWYMARVATAPASMPVAPPFPADVLNAVEQLHAANVAVVSWESLGLELLARVRQQPRHERRWTTLKEAKGHAPKWGGEERALFGPQISDAESEDLAPAFPAAPYALTGRNAPNSVALMMPPPNEDFGVRTVTLLIGLPWGDVLKLTHCDARPKLQAFAHVAYRPDGRPRQISIEPGDLSEPCLNAARVLFALSLARGGAPITEKYTDAMVLPLEPERVACEDQHAAMPPEREPASVSRSGAPHRPVPPTRTKMVNPVYPVSAQQNFIEGVVVIDAIISTAGCVAEASVTSSPHPMLSRAALDAVLDWHYTPTMLDGVPIAVVMTVTVNFSLHR